MTASDDKIIVWVLLGLLLQVGVVALGVRWGVTSALRSLLTPGSSDRVLLTETLREAALSTSGDGPLSSVSQSDDAP